MPGQVAHLGLGRVVEPTQGQPTHLLFTTQTHLLSNPLLTPPFSVSWAATPNSLVNFLPGLSAQGHFLPDL